MTLVEGCKSLCASVLVPSRVATERRPHSRRIAVALVRHGEEEGWWWWFCSGWGSCMEGLRFGGSSRKQTLWPRGFIAGCLHRRASRRRSHRRSAGLPVAAAVGPAGPALIEPPSPIPVASHLCCLVATPKNHLQPQPDSSNQAKTGRGTKQIKRTYRSGAFILPRWKRVRSLGYRKQSKRKGVREKRAPWVCSRGFKSEMADHCVLVFWWFGDGVGGRSEKAAGPR